MAFNDNESTTKEIFFNYLGEYMGGSIGSPRILKATVGPYNKKECKGMGREFIEVKMLFFFFFVFYTNSLYMFLPP